MKIAIVDDYFTQMGGAEKVAEEFYRMLPQADLHATVALQNRACRFARCAGFHLVDATLAQDGSLLPHLFLLYPLAVSSLKLSSYDLIISSSSGYAKGIQTRSDALHICYCHTPLRWAWSF